MKIENYKPNAWRVRKTVEKKTYTVIFDHKPTQKEALQALADKMANAPTAEKGTILYFCNKYIDSRSNLLKASTKEGYTTIIRNLPSWLSSKQLNAITQEDMKRYVNDMAEKLSAKTIKNRYSFILTVIYEYNPHFVCKVNLPVIPDREPYIPTPEDITAIVKSLEGTKYEIPVKLACLGLRRSEIGALTIDDIHDGRAYIDKALVYCNRQWVLESSNKTAASSRYVELPNDLYQKILNQGYVYDGSMHTIFDVLRRTCKQLGIPEISIHKLRHFFASYAHSQGFTEAQIMEMGGWSTPHIMKKVYRHAMNMERATKVISDDIGTLFQGQD